MPPTAEDTHNLSPACAYFESFLVGQGRAGWLGLDRRYSSRHFAFYFGGDLVPEALSHSSTRDGSPVASAR